MGHALALTLRALGALVLLLARVRHAALGRRDDRVIGVLAFADVLNTVNRLFLQAVLNIQAGVVLAACRRQCALHQPP